MARSPNNPPRRSAPHTRLPLRQAIALGLLQGPTELLPVSSSGHTTLIPWLAQWDYARLQPELRKSFEVALHAGAAAALLVDLSRREYKDARVGSRKVMVLRARAPSRVRARAAPSFFK
ncbi:MAG TPA: undecaprenyl-diphosphate phosphatase, partial [Solirubrobacteraceae bacterium]|nr:undecaprenyl-diphosphate phosphatase [Solirubrobacteraceae bacterium]